MSFTGSGSASSPRRKKMRNQSDSNSDFDGKSDFKLSKGYSKYVIVAENEFDTPAKTGKSTEVAFHNALWKIYAEPPADCSPTYSTGSSYIPSCDTRVCCNYMFSTNTDCHAEILFIYEDCIRLTIRKKFKIGTTTPHYDNAEVSTSVVIRILEEKKHFVETLSDQWALIKLADLWTPDVTFVVNGEKCEANRQYLANASPVFRTMLFGKFAEAKQSEIVLEGIGSADVFKDFLLAVSPFRVQPNPTNVFALLKLAHQYDVPNLVGKCEEHLKFCYEIPKKSQILKKKKCFVEILADQGAPDVTFVINGEKCEANREYLANASPVFRKMLFGKFAEAKQSEIVLEGIGSADVFKDFLLAVSPFRVQPNHKNVLSLLKLAHQYDIPILMRMCEEHLKFCNEIPVEDRIFLAHEYELNELKAHTAHVMTDACFKRMWKEHKEKLLKPEFLYLLDIHMDRLK
ncbi:BTB/POZ domain-containing protein [Ditylenchus destructor]|nr:BTB/POZ domain-containing protein [Ditylenchus destructor]